MKPRELLLKIAASQTNVRFRDLERLAVALGFELDRVKGSHHIYIHSQHTGAILNLQPDGKDAKPYQVRQLLKLVEAYNLSLSEEQ